MITQQIDHSNVAKKFSDARRNFMLPHPQGVPYAVFAALFDASQALVGVELDALEETPREWIEELQEFLDTSEFQHLESGQLLEKAKGFTEDELLTIRHLICELADWFAEAARD